jgi:Family of unknown function (DUF6138)
MEERNYLVKIEGNEALLDRFIAAVLDGTCSVDEKYPNPYKLPTGETFLDTSVINYFLDNRTFSYERSIEFFEKTRKLGNGFGRYSYTLGEWFKKNIQKPFFKKTKISSWQESWSLKPDVDTSKINPEILSFMCYVAVCHIKYGASYETVTANEYFDIVTAAGSDEVAKLKKVGTGKLSQELSSCI